MKRRANKLLAVSVAIVFLVLIAPSGFAHSGRTDASGGHRDTRNASGLGSYHYHHGYSAHLHPGGYCPYTDVFPTGVRLSTEKTTLGMDEKAEIVAAVSPSNACSTSVSWSSSDSSVVRVSGGRITAVGFGTATVTATTFNDKRASIKITVHEITADSITLTGVDESTQTLYINDTMKMGVVLTPENVDRPEITWASSDEHVASVEDGLITALGAGAATITATTTNGLTAQVALTVEEIIAQKIEIEAPEEITIGDSVQLEAVITPDNTTYRDVHWQSSDTAVAEITKDGLLTAKGVGKVTVQAIQKDVQTNLTIDIQHIPVTKVSILAAGGFEGTLSDGETVQFSTDVWPSDATYPQITWTSSDPAVATVDGTGLVRAVGKGEVTLTASTQDGVDKTITFRAGSKTNMAAIAGGAGGGGVAALGAACLVLKKKKKSAEGECKKGVDRITASFLALAVAVAGGAGFVGVESSNADKYDRALFLAEAGRPNEAAALFEELGGYQDSADRLNALKEEFPVVNFQFVAEGDTVILGGYEQDNDLTNGKEPIEWLVLDKNEERILAVSQKVLDVRAYMPDDGEDYRALYQWLYTDFYEDAFGDTNMSSVRELRLLTRDDCEQYTSRDNRKAEYTPYAMAQGPDRGYASGYMWWLDGYFLFSGEDVGPVVWEDGDYSNTSTDVDKRVGIRPALVISLVNGEEQTFTFYSGMKDDPAVTVGRDGAVIPENDGGDSN